MAEVTDADRERAEELAYPLLAGTDFQPVVDAIAAALADERERALAPVLALADELELTWRGCPEDAGATLAAVCIRRAAGQQP